MTNIRPDDLNRQTLVKLPCLCKKQHSRLYLSVMISETSFKSLFASFSEVNKFIQLAKKAQNDKNKVLIFGKENFSQTVIKIDNSDLIMLTWQINLHSHLKVICSCCQYLMVEYGINSEQALKLTLQKTYSFQFHLEKCYHEYLNQLEVYLKHLSNNFHPSTQLSSLQNQTKNFKNCLIKTKQVTFRNYL